MCKLLKAEKYTVYFPTWINTKKAEKYTVYFPTWINTKKDADSSKFLTSSDSEIFNVSF